MNNTTNEQSYPDIYRGCFPKLVTYLQKCHACKHQDAEDIAAQALHILWEKWDTLETHTEAGILRWLMQTAKNLLRDEAKKKARHPVTVSLDDLTDQQRPTIDMLFPPEQSEAEYARCLAELIKRLSASDAALLCAKVEKRQTDAEIAAQLGISINALRVRWLRVKKKIRDVWDEVSKST